MSKKLWIAGLIASILLIGLTGTALAAAGDFHPGNPPGPDGGEGFGGRHRRLPHAVGEVTSIGDDEFTFLTRSEVEVTVLIDEDTKYLGDLEGFGDLEVGMVVGAAGARQGEGTFLAKAIFAGDRLGDLGRAGGEVTDVGNSTLTIDARNGESITFMVDENTRFRSRDGEVEDLSDIEESDHVVVIYLEQENGDLLAKTIGVGKGPCDCDAKGQGHGQSPMRFGSRNF